VTSTLADEISVREPVLDTVVSGSYAQIGLLEYPGEPIPARVYEEARAYLRELGCEVLAAQIIKKLLFRNPLIGRFPLSSDQSANRVVPGLND
jgi:ABC-type molybdenum transport system ATPase subunit/photorepair protein PhrA